jgi:HEAT repeat protein/ATP/ADP translocase
MLSNIRQISILNKVFNLNESEWPKIIISWAIRFFHRAGFVIGWTVLVAMFTSRFGIASLPYLFAVNALFTIIGSFFYSAFIDKVSRTWLMIATVFLAGIILLFATQVASVNQTLFFILLLVAEAILAVQLKIFFDGYIEGLFTPLESERTFPLIEAAETLGGMIAAVIIVTFSSSIDTYKFIYVWAICLFLIIPFILVFESMNKKATVIESLEEENHEKESKNEGHGIIALIKEELKSAKNLSLLKGLFLLVFFQWLLFNMLEFQYTKAVYNSVSNVVLEGGSGFEHAFVHGLGVLFMIFSVSTLVIQLFVGSRLISALGVIGSMIVHPILTIISLLGLIFSFNYYLAVLAKNNFTLTTAIFNNAYASTYYALKEKVLIHGREFIEGVVRPVGALAGTLILIVLSLILPPKGMIFAVNALMIVVAGVFLYITIRQRSNYTKAALNDFTSSDEKKVRMNAIDILSQRGHVDSLPVLIKFLHKKDESVALRVRVLRALAETQEELAIKDIIKCFTSDKAAVREASVDALLKYHVLSQPSKKYAVVKYELVGALKKMYEVEIHEDIRSRIITLLSKLSNVSTLEFLLNILHKSHGNLKADAIYALGNYGDEDVIEFIRPYLKSNPKEKINAAIALGRFPDNKVESTYIISSFIFSKTKAEIAYGLYAVGELNLKKFKKICLQYLHSKNIQLKMYSALALAKMGYHEAIPALVDLLFNENREVAKHVKDMIKNVDVRIYKNIDKIVRYVVDREVTKLIKKHKVKHWSDLQKEHLITLKWLYCLVEEYDEVELIDNLI